MNKLDELEQRKKELVREKESVLKLSEEIDKELKGIKETQVKAYNDYFNKDRGREFLLLGDIPPFSYLNGENHPLKLYANINIEDLFKLIKRYYELTNAGNVALENVEKVYVAKEKYGTTYTRLILPYLDVKIDGTLLQSIPYTSDSTYGYPIKCLRWIDSFYGSEQHEIKISPYLNLIQTQIVQKYRDTEHLYVTSYVGTNEFNNDRELLIDYGNETFIRDLVFSIAYFQKQNNTYHLTSKEFEEEISNPLIRSLIL